MLSELKKSGAALVRVALGAAVLVLLLSTASAQAATPLYPNLKTLSPRDLRFDSADVDASEATVTHKVLRFSNTVWDTGPGRLEVRGLIDSKTKTGPATQRVYDDGGGFTDLSVGSFYYHPAHGHYHFDNWGRYELWTKAGYDAWLASGRTQGNPTVGGKTTSCMIDEEFIRNVPNQPYPPAYGTEGCFPDSQGRMLQGISPGWGDTYDYFRFEQWIDLGATGSLANGQYVLRSVVDPTNKIYESPNKGDVARESAEDNEAITMFSVQNGILVDSNPPTGSVRINDINTGTASPNVTVKVLGRDDISGVTQLRFSNDGNAWSLAQAYTGKESNTQTIAWSLTDPAYGGNNIDGTKTVYVQLKDATGNWSAAESDTIVLDRGGGSSAYSNAVLADGPVGYWRLGEKSGTTASDAAGANLGAYRNGALLGQPSLLPGDSANSSVRFDGSNDYVDIPSSSALSPTAKVSLEAWIKPVALPSTGNFASVASKPESYSLQFNGPRLEFTIMQSGARRRLQAPVGAIATGQVYHVVGTYDGASQRLYVNGAEVASASLGGAITANSNELDLASWSEGGEPFNGTIDEVAVYAGALSAARVGAHYQAGSGAAPPDTTVKDPSSLSATAVSETRIDLKWIDNSTNEGEFLIQRDTNSSFPSPVVLSAWANSTSFQDTGLTPGTTYYYRVRARNATDTSAYSNVANATTLTAPPPPPPPPPPTEYRAAVIADGPVGYWRLGEKSGTTASDAAGANLGAYRNGALLGQPSLLPGDSANTAVRFDGSNDYVAIPSTAALRPTAKVSLEAWIKPLALPTTGNFASIASKPESYSLQFNGPRLEFTIMQSGARRRLQAPVGTIATGQAYHVVGTYDGSIQRLYVNGAEVASASLGGAITTNSNALDIASWSGGSEPFNGTIDEVAVYAGALSAARVGAHYQAGSSTSKAVALTGVGFSSERKLVSSEALDPGRYSITSPPTFSYYCELHSFVAQKAPSTSWGPLLS